MTTPLNVFWHSGRNDNFTTTPGQGETDARGAGYNFIRTTGHIFTSQVAGTVPLNVYWNGSRQDNFTCAHPQGQKDALDAGYQFIRTAGYVYPAGSGPSGCITLRSYWNGSRNDNFTCADAQGDSDAQGAGYTVVRDDCQILPSAAPIHHGHGHGHAHGHKDSGHPSSEYDVWGVNAGGAIFYRYGVTSANKAGVDWTPTDGAAVYVSCGGGNVWVVNSAGQAFARAGVTNSTPMGSGWVSVPGDGITKVSCGADGGVAAINTKDEIMNRVGVSPSNPAGDRWENYKGWADRVARGRQSVCCINRSNQLYRKSINGADDFQPCNPSDAVCVGLGSDDLIYVVHKTGAHSRYDGGAAWLNGAGGEPNFQCIDAGDAHNIWGVSTDQAIWQGSCSHGAAHFTRVPGSLTVVACSRRV
jgi:hypothetical protein